ncbi:hypothetical protein B0O80DRAFT_531390 [Mortierella sp. GBAus27b]|nr:hypothetical protein B0O80DRAFT_531390 [Mortierella sp. GBAus27b]
MMLAPFQSINTRRIWVVIIVLFSRWSHITADPLIPPPSSWTSFSNTPELSLSSLFSSTAPVAPPNPTSSSSSPLLSQLPGKDPGSSTPLRTKSTGGAASPTPNIRYPVNKAAASLKLVHVPLKVSCDILRQFYNSTGGINWSNQDGWQYVDSVTIPPVPTRGYVRAVHEPSDPKTARVHPSASHAPPEPHRTRALPYAGRIKGTDPYQGALTGSPSSLDPNNCCGWYGVICIGPDGVMPPPWPPYDDDLISSRALARKPTDPIRKRGDATPPYYDYHDRNQHRHSKDSGKGHGNNSEGRGNSPLRGSGRIDNRIQPDDDNNEPGRPLEDSNRDDDRQTMDSKPESDAESRTQPPSQAVVRSGQIDDWYIIELHLGFNGLSGPVPEDLSGLANLMILDISNNDLTGQIPASYGSLTRLRRFDMSSNLITGPFPIAVTQMVNLQQLVLKNNCLTGSLPPELLRLKQLTELSIANNDFDGMLPSGLFSSLTKLRVVNMNQNGFTGEISPEIGSLVALLKFSARANEFKGRIPAEIGNCQQLETVDLGDNHFTGEIPESIYGLQNLRVLDLPDNKLSGQLSPKIGNMISMMRLILSHNELDGPLPTEIQNLTRLEYMVLNYNSFDGQFPIALAPQQLTVCLVQPNAFTACPPNASIETPTTLAYQCNMDCRDRVIRPELSDAISHTSPQWRVMQEENLLGISAAFFVTVIMQVL